MEDRSSGARPHLQGGGGGCGGVSDVVCGWIGFAKGLCCTPLFRDSGGARKPRVHQGGSQPAVRRPSTPLQQLPSCVALQGRQSEHALRVVLQHLVHAPVAPVEPRQQHASRWCHSGRDQVLCGCGPSYEREPPPDREPPTCCRRRRSCRGDVRVAGRTVGGGASRSSSTGGCE
jgi:hypothetical protein